jgi:hypothetical protein
MRYRDNSRAGPLVLSVGPRRPLCTSALAPAANTFEERTDHFEQTRWRLLWGQPGAWMRTLAVERLVDPDICFGARAETEGKPSAALLGSTAENNPTKLFVRLMNTTNVLELPRWPRH